MVYQIFFLYSNRRVFSVQSTCFTKAQALLTLHYLSMLMALSSQVPFFRKARLSTHFKLQDLSSLKDFLSLEIAGSNTIIFVSLRHYTLQLLEDAGLLAAKPKSCPMDP